MRRLLILALTLLLLFSFAVTAFAVELDILEYRDGNTYLGTFETSTLSDSVKAEFEQLITSPTSLITYSYDTGHVCIVDIVSTDNVFVSVNSDGLCDITAVTGGEGFGGQIWEKSGDVWTLGPYLSQTPDTTLRDVVLVGGLALDDIDIFGSDGVDDTYIADIDGLLYVSDDSDSISGGGSDVGSGGSDDEEDSEDSGVLGFLGDFWNKFKSFLVGLFVPSEGYFKAWYNELKAAFEEKLSPIFDLFNQISGFFDGLSAASDDSTLFNNTLFAPWLSWIRALVTGLVLLLTFIAAYKKIISFIAI